MLHTIVKTDKSFDMAFTKEQKIDILDTARYLHDSLKTYLKDDDISDSLLLLYSLKATQISQTLLKELNSRSVKGEQIGWQFELLKKFRETYPDFE